MVKSKEVNSNSIKEMIDSVQADREAKKVFLSMPREEQLLAILGMIAFLTTQIANLQKENIEYRQQREVREEKLAEILDTDPHIKALSPEEKQSTLQKIIALATRPAKSGQLTDKVISIILVIIFVVYLSGKLP